MSDTRCANTERLQIIKTEDLKVEMKTDQTVQIYICKINENLTKDKTEYLLRFLSKEKKERFYNFHFVHDSLRTLYGEIIVRFIVSKQFNMHNDQIHIKKNKYGKPYIQNLPMHFNISHSGDWVACAISTKNIGIDIERIKNVPAGMAKRFFSSQEYDFLMKTAVSKRQDAFYDLWTLKESYLKWIGSGLSIPLNSFCFTISDTGISVSDKNKAKTPFFKQYPVDGYKLSVCASSSNFPDKTNYISIENMFFN